MMRCSGCGKDVKGYITVHLETGEEYCLCDDCENEYFFSDLAWFFAQRIFRGFCSYYASLRITDKEDISTITRRILRYFDELGSMLNYQVSAEWTMKTLLESPPKEIEKKRIDMIWLEAPASLFLALEYENESDMKVIESDLEKLVASEAQLSIIYCYPIEKDRVVSMVKAKMKEKYADKLPWGNQVLIMLDPWTSRSSFGTGILEAVLINRRGEEVGRGKAEVIKEERSGSRMFIGVSWNST